MDALKSRERGVSLLVFGCGLALGLTGLYGYYRSKKIITKEMRSLNQVVESLKQEVDELRRSSRSQSTISLQPAATAKTTSLRFHDEADRASDIASGDEEFYDFAETDSPEGTDSLESAVAHVNMWFGDSNIDKNVLYVKVEELCNLYNRPPELVCLLTKASNYLVTKAAKDGDVVEQKKMAFHTFHLGEEALSKGPDSAECHKWFAIGIGGISDFVPVKEKIANGSTFKKHVDMAVALAPADATLHHMLGRFCYQIANLSWIEKKVASALFGQVPDVTLDDALQHLRKAYELKPDWKENILYLVKCSIELKQPDACRQFIEEGIALPIRGEDDEICHKEFLLLKSRYLK